MHISKTICYAYPTNIDKVSVASDPKSWCVGLAPYQTTSSSRIMSSIIMWYVNHLSRSDGCSLISQLLTGWCMFCFGASPSVIIMSRCQILVPCEGDGVGERLPRVLLLEARHVTSQRERGKGLRGELPPSVGSLGDEVLARPSTQPPLFGA